jgi:hypothetical protein
MLCNEVFVQKSEQIAALTESFPLQISSKYNLRRNFLLYRKSNIFPLKDPSLNVIYEEKWTLNHTTAKTLK